MLISLTSKKGQRLRSLFLTYFTSFAISVSFLYLGLYTSQFDIVTLPYSCRSALQLSNDVLHSIIGPFLAVVSLLKAWYKLIIYLFFDLIDRVVSVRAIIKIDDTTELRTHLCSNLVCTLNNILVPTELRILLSDVQKRSSMQCHNLVMRDS